ncbi:MAG: M56 family metallopeptidase [Planctomycetota bacterium]
MIAAWCLGPGLGALCLGAVALGLERAASTRIAGLATGLWWAALARLALPPGFGSPIGWSASLPATAEVAPYESVALALWIGGASVVAVCAARRLVAERRRWRRLERRAPRAGTRRVAARLAYAAGRSAPPIFVVDAAPACVGLVGSWIALPADLERAGRRGDLEVVLLHELAHCRRRDGWRRLAVLAFQIVFWFHPVTWLAGRHLARAAEVAADREAARGARHGVAGCRRALIAEASRWCSPETGSSLAFAAPRSLLFARLAALEQPARFPASLALVGFLAAFACIGPVVLHVRVPPIDELEGCLQKRFAVYHALALERASNP